MLKVLQKIFGSKSDKDIKLITPVVDEINRIYEEYHSLSEEELKNKTNEFRELIKNNSRELEDEKVQILDRLRNEVLSSKEVTDLNDRMKELDQLIHEEVEETLDEILPEAYAVVKQACHRLAEQGHAYEYAGNKERWFMVPYDVQLIGGIVLQQGKIAEMATGEGKTLVAVMPLYLNSLAGKGAHLVTVNDYLARRDAEWMLPVYEYLGLSVGIIQSNMHHDERKRMYNCDITYGTNNEFGFDYLRDNMVVETEQMVQREHWYAIVDEVDSVLIDEARTPLIISGPVSQAQDQKFEEMNPRVKRLVEAQNRLVNKLTSEAAELVSKLTGGKDDKDVRDKAGMLLLRAHRGLPKHKKLTKLLQDPDNQKLLKETELFFLRDQGRRMHEIDDELYYTIDEKNHQIDISDKGRDLLITTQEDPEMFVIPDITAQMSELEGSDLPEEEKQVRKDRMNLLYAERSDRIHTVSQLLRAYSLYEKDIEYVVQNGKVMIVDEFTGRILEGRRYSEGLHQAIEAKESVKVERDTQTLATITLQNYFRLYNKLAGMTGTAETEAAEFEKIYKLEVVVIPTNKPIIREDQDDFIYRTTREKYNAILEEINTYLDNGRPVLVGTASVEVSEILSKMLRRKNVQHNVLNAKQHDREAEIVSQAGRKGMVTIATNMAGRGTDIKIDHEVKKNGGLAIIGSERHDARRIDRQLRGRAGRQGDPGSSVFFISLEDKLMRLFGGERIAGVMQSLKVPEGEPIQHSMITKSVERAQRKVEENNFGIRKRLLEYDDVMNQQRTVIYNRRKSALRGERLKGELFDYIEEMAAEWYDEYHPLDNLKGLKDECRSKLLCEPDIKEGDFKDLGKDECVAKILNAADDFYKRKEEMVTSEFMARLERVAVLQTIDEKWRDHLRVMDDIKEGIHLRSYGQKNPLLEYKGEAFRQFVELIKEINNESIEFAFKYFPKVVEQRIRMNAPAPKGATPGDDGLPKLRTVGVSRMQYKHQETSPAFLSQGQQPPVPQQPDEASPGGSVQTVKRTDKKIGRNELVKVRFADGSIKKVKYKKVEQDIIDGKAEIVE
ncbi:MAG: preprotein translocase subunit SecA [Candidatus Kapaibacterium sp.]